jgi:hypothetical protein
MPPFKTEPSPELQPQKQAEMSEIVERTINECLENNKIQLEKFKVSNLLNEAVDEKTGLIESDKSFSVYLQTPLAPGAILTATVSIFSDITSDIHTPYFRVTVGSYNPHGSFLFADMRSDTIDALGREYSAKGPSRAISPKKMKYENDGGEISYDEFTTSDTLPFKDFIDIKTEESNEEAKRQQLPTKQAPYEYAITELVKEGMHILELRYRMGVLYTGEANATTNHLSPAATFKKEYETIKEIKDLAGFPKEYNGGKFHHWDHIISKRT